MSDTRTAPPVTLWMAIGALVVEALGALTGAVLLVIAALTGPAASTASGVSTVVIAVLLAAVFALLAFLLRRRTRAARGPALVLEFLLLPIGWYMTKGGIPWVGVPLLLVALTGAAGLLAPQTRVELGIGIDE